MLLRRAVTSIARRGMISQAEKAIGHIFTYGSLRPDDDSGQSWTKDFVQGLTQRRAVLRGARLFKDEYAAVVLDDKKDKAGRVPEVQGWVLGTDDENLLADRLRVADDIEAYVNAESFYQRTAVTVKLLDSDDEVDAWVYLTPRCDRSNPIPSGDWLHRSK